MATTLGANAQLYTWQFHSITGNAASGQITSTDPNYPLDAAFFPVPVVASSASFFIADLSLNIDMTTALNSAMQFPGVGLVPGVAPDGGSSLWLGPFKDYEPALELSGISFTINPAENGPREPDPQQWEYAGPNGPLSGTGYWELAAAPVPEPTTLALAVSGAALLVFARRRR